MLADMMGLLNGAVHGAKIDSRAADWAMDVGPRLPASLDKKMKQGYGRDHAAYYRQNRPEPD